MTPRTLAGFLVAALLLAGCAKVPTTGPVEAGRGGRPEGVRGQEPIQVFAQRPQDGWTPAQVVSGFLAAMATPSDDDEIARSYLTPDVRAGWPSSKDPAVRVYAQDDDFRLEVGRDDTVTITANERATISNSGEYQPSPEGTTMEAVFRMQRMHGQWRIGSLPNTKMMSAYDAVSAYSPFDVYFFGEDSNVLVPSPIVLPSADRDDWPTDLTRALINGPQGSVAPGVASAIPSDTVLESSPTIDDNGRLTVQLGGAAGLTGSRRSRMIAQLTATLLRIEGVSEVEVGIDGDSAVYGSGAYSTYEATRVVSGKRGYFINGNDELVAVDAAATDVDELAGPFGTGALTFTKPAVSLDGRRAAGLSVDGDELWVGPLNAKGKPTQLYEGKALSAPSWDRNGNLWVVENADGGPRLLRFTDGRGEPAEVEAAGLSSLHVSSVRLSWDGVRIAFAVGSGDAGELRTAVLDRDGDGKTSVRNVRPVAPSLTAVDDVWWYDARTLAVAAREQSDLRASYLVSVDGLSLRKVSSVRDLDAMAAGTGMPLLVTDHDGRVAISHPDEFSSTTVGSGHSPAYPG